MEFASKKYIFLLILVCSVFAIFIIKAFDYLPDKSVESNNNNINVNNQYQSPITAENQNYQQPQNQNYDPERHKSGHVDFMPKPAQEQNSKNDYEEIKAPKGTYEDDINVINNNSSNTTYSPDDLAVKSLVNAIKLKNMSDYSNALNELQKVSEYTNDSELLALSYEKTAEIYAIQRRFGTALSFAGKAYNTAPNSYREMLIARIYYQSGDTQTAITRLNNLLTKGFKD